VIFILIKREDADLGKSHQKKGNCIPLNNERKEKIVGVAWFDLREGTHDRKYSKRGEKEKEATKA